VGELIRHALSDVLARGNVQDPVLETAIISVSEVKMSPDLRNATAYVVPLGRQDPAPVLDALKRARKFLRGELAREINLRYMPELRFASDTSFDYAENVEGLLRSPKVARDLQEDDWEGGEETDTPRDEEE
jgi:ribosome-binding factor A